MAIQYKQKSYQCCYCARWWKLEPNSMGAVGNDGLYCLICTKKCYLVELELYNGFIKNHKTLPDYTQLARMKCIAWTCSAVLNKKEAMIYNG